MSQANTAIHQQVEAARRGELPRVIARMPSGWAVLGDPQITRGYSLLLPDPVVSDLNALTGDARRQFLEDMAKLGDAVLATTGAERINYEILGNVEPALHAHVIPRHASEDPGLRKKPVWLHDWPAAPPIDEAALALARRSRGRACVGAEGRLFAVHAVGDVHRRTAVRCGTVDHSRTVPSRLSARRLLLRRLAARTIVAIERSAGEFRAWPESVS